MRNPPSLPVALVTGFLGSGKTTLLARLLRHPDMANTAVIINEFGDIGLDHHLIAAAEGNTVVMESGCICCSIRDDLEVTLLDLATRRDRGAIPAFNQVVIETTGLADPLPILHLLLRSRALTERYRHGAVITTVDAVNGDRQFGRHCESIRQVALADQIVLTKTDLADADTVGRILQRIHALNPRAPILRATGDTIEPAMLLLGIGSHEAMAPFAGDLPADSHAGHHHGEQVRAHSLILDTPLDWETFSDWFGSLAFFQGDRILRMKGLLNLVGEAGPVAVHGVHRLFHPPERLAAWPSADRRSKLVFITDGLPREDIEQSLAAAIARVGAQLGQTQ